MLGPEQSIVPLNRIPDWLQREYDYVDHQLSDLMHARCALLTKRNSLAFISRIPSEILSEIFQAYIDDTRRYISGVPDNHWFRFSHVCHRWRIVALNNPALWSHITFHQPAWVMEMLKRSKAYPLTVEITPSYYKPSVIPAVDATLQQLDRIRRLRFTAASDSIMENHLGSMKVPVTNLQSLDLTIGGQTSGSYFLPNDLFDGVAPHLRSLSLTGCAIDWRSSLLRNLTVLRISFASSAQFRVRPRLSQVLDGLKHLLLLEELSFERCSPSCLGETLPTRNSHMAVTLPRLKCLHLLDITLPNAALIQHITIPPQTIVRLFCTNNSDNDDCDFSVICLALAESSSIYREHSLQVLTIEQTTDTTIRIRGQPSCCPSDIPDLLELNLNWQTWRSYKAISVSVSVCQNLYLTHLHTLHIHDIGYVAQSTWVQTFCTLTHLDILHVHGQPLYGLIGALTSNGETTETDTDSESTMFLPRLRKLIIEDARFEVATFGRLSECLLSRKCEDIGIRELHICRCSGINDTNVNPLKVLVPIVLWDGVTGEATSGADSGSEVEEVEESPSCYGSGYQSLDEFDYQD